MNEFIFWTTLVVLFVVIIYLSVKYDLLKDKSTAIPKPYSYARVQLAWWSLIVITSFITVIIITGKIPTLNLSTLVVLGISAVTTASARIIDISDSSNASTALASAINSTTTAAAAINTTAAANTALSTINTTDPAMISAANNTANSAIITATAASAAAATAAAKTTLSRNLPGELFILDILSDKDGVSIQRLQAVIFNLAFGIWFLYEVYNQINGLTAISALKLVTVIDPVTNTPLPNKDFLLNQILPVITKNNLILLGLSAGTYAALKTTENK